MRTRKYMFNMKKYLSVIAIMLITIGLQAKPVSIEEARALASKYVSANMSNVRSTEVNLVYTLSGEGNSPYLYVMNYENGFVVMSADDIAKPVLAYSIGDLFDVNDIPEGMEYYLNFYKRQIEAAVEQGIQQDEETANEWRDLRVNGLPMSRDAKVVTPLLSTTWDQDNPYNYYCPSTSSGPGGKAYAGCVATAMSQIMKYWNHPAQGMGSHSYVVNMEGSELNGTQMSADFSTATYDWNNMPNSLGWSSSATQRNAVALLMYHCGISVDMGYSGSGSGTQSAKVPNALRTYFSYSNQSRLLNRDSYSKTEFEDLLIECLDNGFPIHYSGHDDSSGHAFVCDGYDSSRKFHFNWGWSGNGNNSYFAIDALNPTIFYTSYNFNLGQQAIINIMPDYIGASLPLAPDPFNFNQTDPTSLSGTLTWTNPTKSWDNTTLTSLTKVVLMRNGNVIKTYTSVQPGQEMSFVDNVSALGVYDYTVYAESQYGKGNVAHLKALYGPSCEWRFMCSSNSTQGWPGGGLTVYNSSNVVVSEMTLSSSGLHSEYVTMPEGNISIKWTQPSVTVSNVTILIQNEAGQTLATYTNQSSTSIPQVVYSGNNECKACAEPIELEAEVMQQSNQWGVKLTWEKGGESNPAKYYVYRSGNGNDYDKIAEVTGSVKTYFDPVEGDYYYKVTAKYSNCESDYGSTVDGADFVHVTIAGVSEKDDSVMIYPNPANNKLHLKGAGINAVALYNIVGQAVYNSQNRATEQTIDLGGMPSGVYMLKVSTNDGDVVRRVSVVR